jgi:hypothetical protein
MQVRELRPTTQIVQVKMEALGENFQLVKSRLEFLQFLVLTESDGHDCGDDFLMLNYWYADGSFRHRPDSYQQPAVKPYRQKAQENGIKHLAVSYFKFSLILGIDSLD